MPELFIEPLTDRQTCFKCQKTVTGKKKLSKCAGCHAITYCGQECQREDWPRHKWNCVPVMVTEIPGKGRGIVAARDIKMGELIFNDKPVIKQPVDPNSGKPACPIDSLNLQIGKLPTEAKYQFYKLWTWSEFDTKILTIVPEHVFANRNKTEFEGLKLFLGNARFNRKGNYFSLYLNLALVNHSCAPNAEEGELRPEIETKDQVHQYELRAIKGISRGEEINTSYFYNSIKGFGYDAQKMKEGLMQEQSFDCVCSVCSGQVADQQEILKRLAELQLQFNPEVIGFEKWEVRIQDKIVDLTMQLYIGKLDDKIRELDIMVRIAHLARDQNLVRKAMDMWKQLVVDTQLAEVGRTCQIMDTMKKIRP